MNHVQRQVNNGEVWCYERKDYAKEYDDYSKELVNRDTISLNRTLKNGKIEIITKYGCTDHKIAGGNIENVKEPDGTRTLTRYPDKVIKLCSTYDCSLRGCPTAIAGIIKFLIFVVIYFAIVIGMVFIQESERRIPIQYANKSTNAFGSAAQSFMPIKINTAGVVPVIFASSLLSIPSIIAQVVNKEGFTLFVQKYLTYTTPVGFGIYVIFIFLFAYFYTFIQVKPEEFAKNLQENGGYIPGIRPGDETKKYISRVLSRLTVLGATFLVVIAGLPILFSSLTSLPTSVSIGGTGLLIVVGVALETYKQLEGSILTRSYSRGYSRR